MSKDLNVLFVCGANKRRSKTAGQIFRGDARFYVRTAGLSPKSPHQLSVSDMEWADVVFVMEYRQKKRIVAAYRTIELPEIEVLHIDDLYEYMNAELIELLKDGVNDYLRI